MSRSIRRVVGPVVVLLGLGLVPVAVAQSGQVSARADSAHRAAVYAMLVEMKVGDQIIETIQASMMDTTGADGFPEPYRMAFLVKAKSRIGDLVQVIVPAFAAQLSPQDVKEISAFYRTPAGQRLIAVRAMANPELEKAAERWAMKVIGEVMIEMGDQPTQSQ